jgi:predicted kinase
MASSDRRPKANRPGDPGTSVGRLVLICGLPGAGKTTLARRLEAEFPSVRLCPDEWLASLGMDLFDVIARSRIEHALWLHAQQLLRLGVTVVMENGFWDRAKRDDIRHVARALGAAVELRYLDVPIDELSRRLDIRAATNSAVDLTPAHLAEWAPLFEAPTHAELELYDRPLTI